MNLILMCGPLLILGIATLAVEAYLKRLPDPARPQATPLTDAERDLLRQRLDLQRKRERMVEWMGEAYVLHPKRLRGEVS